MDSCPSNAQSGEVKTPCTLDNGGSELSSHDLHKSFLGLLKESVHQGHPLITSSLRESNGLSMPTSAVEHAKQLKSSGPVALGPNSGDLVSEGEEQNVAEADQADNIHSKIATTDNDAQLLEKDAVCQMPANLKATVNDGENKSLCQITSVLGNSTSSLPYHLSPVKKVSDLDRRILDVEQNVQANNIHSRIATTDNDSRLLEQDATCQMPTNLKGTVNDSENMSLYQTTPVLGNSTSSLTSNLSSVKKVSNFDRRILDAELSVVPEKPNEDGDPEFDPNEERLNVEKHLLFSSKISVWTEQSLCMKCEKDGQLLSCLASGCIVSVHESCLGPLALGCLEKTGLFYCPFCYYSKARKNLSRARNALLFFMGKKSLSATAPRETSQASVSENEDNQPNLQSSQNQRGKSVDCSLNEKENHQYRGVADDRPKACLSNVHAVDPVCDVSNSAAVDHVEVTDDHQMMMVIAEVQHNDHVEVTDDIAEVQHNEPGDLAHPMDNEPCGGQKLAEPRATTDNCNSEIRSQSNRRSKRKRHDTSVGSFDHNSSPGDGRKLLAVRAKHMPNQMSSLCRRERVFWSPEEEKALKDEVKKSGSRSDGTFPWRQILELGGDKFHISRTPSDLKDKWRNIMKRELV